MINGSKNQRTTTPYTCINNNTSPIESENDRKKVTLIHYRWR